MPAERVDPTYSSHEFLGLAHVCDWWATPSRRTRLSRHDWKTKLRAFRRAVIAGYGKRESYPRELVYSEWMVAQAAVEWAKSSGDRPTGERDCQEWLREVRVPMLPNRVEPSRQLPWTDRMCRVVAELIDDRRSSPGSIAKRLLAERLLPTRDAVKPSKGNRLKTLSGLIARVEEDQARDEARMDPSDAQMMAASVYLDLAIRWGNCERMQCQARLLDALVASAYPPIAVFYLIQSAQRVPSCRSVHTIGPDDIALLCRELGSDGDGPFHGVLDRSSAAH